MHLRFFHILALAGAASLTAQAPPPPTIAPPPESPLAARGVRFVDATASAGISGFRHVSGTPEKNYIIEAPGSGCASFDYDNDGRLDIHITNFADDSNVLYHNDDGRSFSDVTFAAGVGDASPGFSKCLSRRLIA